MVLETEPRVGQHAEELGSEAGELHEERASLSGKKTIFSEGSLTVGFRSPKIWLLPNVSLLVVDFL